MQQVSLRTGKKKVGKAKAESPKVPRQVDDCGDNGMGLRPETVREDCICEECGAKTQGYREYDHMKKRNVTRCFSCFRQAQKELSCS